jgi:hypothetical protein
MPDHDLDKMAAEVREAVQGFRAWTRNSLDHNRIIARAQRIIAGLDTSIGDAVAAQGGLLSLEEIRARLIAREPLDARSREWAVRSWNAFNDGEVVTLLELHPESIGAFRRAVFRAYDVWCRLREASRNRITELVEERERNDLPPLFERPFAQWVTPKGLRDLAARAAIDPDPFNQGLLDLGLGLDWQLTAHVRARTLEALLKRASFERCVELARNLPPDAADMLIPPQELGPRCDRFFKTDQYAKIIARWLDAAAARDQDPRVIDDALITVIGDPMLPTGDAIRWGAVKEATAEGYEALLRRITRTDIEFFFQNLKGATVRERGRFWLRYLPSIKATKSYLTERDRELLAPIAKRSGRSSDRAVLVRAGRMDSSITSAFVLWFEHVAVVEFAESGHASYIWKRSALEKLGFGPRRPRVHEPGDLKDPEEVRGGIKNDHRGDWGWRFADALRRHGIEPSR